MREYKLILKAIDRFNLRLKGLTVLTEAASGNYKWGPVIAAKAGADVIAFAKNSIYASAADVRSGTITLAKKFDLADQVDVVSKIDSKILGSADIITNSGFLRPLNKNKLRYCKDTAVISLMWETWEYRESDLDLSYCHQNGIPVLGVNESHRFLQTISYLGPVVKKLLFERNIEVYKCNFGIVGRGKFANAITKSLTAEGAGCVNVTGFTIKAKESLRNCDALIIADHETDTRYIGKKARITGKEIKKLNRDLVVIHISGIIDPVDLKSNNIDYYPEQIAPPHYMSVATDYAGPKPLIDLFTAGLKVAELLSAPRRKGMTYDRSLESALKDKLCQDFSKKQKALYFS